MLIIKLGGSLLEAGRARHWLQALAVAGAPVVVVPGGGPFADQVRSSQPAMGFDEVAAHQMAILAMAQTACVFKSWCPAWQLGHTTAQLQALLARQLPALWCPTVWPDTPASWDITSDSLAAWLAQALQARGLVLVKSRPAAGPSPAHWAQEGLVDAGFSHQAQAYGGPVRLLAFDADPAAALSP